VQEGSDLIAIVDSVGNYKYVSPSCTAILGITSEEFIGRNTGEFIHPDDLSKAFECLKKLATQKRVELEPVRFQNHKKEWRWMETICTNLIDNPAVCGIVINARDITERIEEQKRLKLLESVITNMQEAVLITEAEPFDEPGPRILYVNEAFTKMTGYTSEEVVGKTPRLLQGPNSDKIELAKLGSSLKKWKPCEITTINYKKNGEEFWINFYVSPIANEKGWFTNWIAIERDVTEETIKKLENQLLAKISLNFNAENNYINAAKELCKTVINYGNFDLVEVWTTNVEKSKMRLISHYVTNAEDEIFYENQQDYSTRKICEGLVGKIWSQQTELLWDDVQDNNDFLRRDEAKKIGLKAVLGIPLVFNNEVVGVLKIGTKNEANYLKKYAPIFKQLEGFIGSELYRKRLENDLSNLYNTIADILVVLDKNGQILKVNQAGCMLTGYSEEEILRHNFSEFLHPDDLEKTFQIANKVKNGEVVSEFENRYITKQGDIIWLSWTFNADITEGLFYATAKNITEEKKLRELNRQASNLAKIGSWEVDLINQTIYWSDFVHQLHETDSKKFVPDMETAINFYREDFRQLVKLSLEKCIATHVPFDFEAVLITSKMKEVWVRVIGNGEFANGVCQRIFGSFQDIDELKNTENRLLSLSENLPGVIYQYTIHPDGTDSINHVSGAIEQLWGYTKEEVLQDITQLWEEINLGGSMEVVKSSILQSIETKSRWTCRFKIVKPNGELRTHFGNGIPNFMADGSIVFNVMVVDITQEAKNEALLSQASEMSRIGSWEKDLINDEDESMYWSPMIKEILGLDECFVPTLNDVIEFCVGESKEQLQQIYYSLINDGIEYDEELLVTNLQGQEKWVRIIGKREIANNKPTRIYGSFQDIDERKRTEEKIKKSEEKRRLIMSGALDSIICIDTDGKITFWNHQAEVVFGWKEEDVIGKVLSDLIVPEPYRNMHNEGIKHYIKTGEEKALNKLLELTAIKKNGEEFPMELTVIPVRQGEEVFFCAFIRDISRRKKAQAEILKAKEDAEESEAKFKGYTEQSSIAIYTTNIEGDCIYANETWLKMTGLDRQEVLGKGWINALHPDDKESIYNNWYKSIESNGKWRYEYRFVNKEGVINWVEGTAKKLFNKKNEFVGYLGTNVNITERKEAEENLLRANERFEKVTEATNDAIWDWDIENQTIYRSKAFENFFGKDAAKSFALDDFWQKHFHPDELEKNQNSIYEAIENPFRNRWELEYKVYNELGETLYIIDRGLIIRNNEGKAIRMVGAMTNITEQKLLYVQLTELNKKLQQHTYELERSNEELEQFAFVASHDLQEPLRMVSSFMDLLKLKYGDLLDEKGHKYIYFATDGAKRMKSIIRDLLEYSKANKSADNKEEVDLNKIISEYKILRSKLISETDALIIQHPLPTLTSYKASITQVFHCLIDNALKYSVEKNAPIITINAFENESEWEFSIKDNGIGIEAEFFNKIFVIFQRLHNANEYSGTGIGLSITKRHVEFFGGRIWLESIVGEGSTFYFTIPKNQIIKT
jgi:PAS domain S-box-containing protein